MCAPSDTMLRVPGHARASSQTLYAASTESLFFVPPTLPGIHRLRVPSWSTKRSMDVSCWDQEGGIASRSLPSRSHSLPLFISQIHASTHNTRRTLPLLPEPRPCFYESSRAAQIAKRCGRLRVCGQPFSPRASAIFAIDEKVTLSTRIGRDFHAGVCTASSSQVYIRFRVDSIT